MRDERTPKDVCGQATVPVDVSHSKTPLLSPLNHNIKIQILICYPYTFVIEVVGRICWSIKSTSSCVIMSLILKTTLFHEAVILQGEIWRPSL